MNRKEVELARAEAERFIQWCNEWLSRDVTDSGSWGLPESGAVKASALLLRKRCARLRR